AYRPLKRVAHAKPASDLLYVHRLALEGEARIAGDHEQPFELRERCDYFLNHAICEILLLGIAAHVFERQHGDGGLVWHRRLGLSLGNMRCSSLSRFTRQTHLIRSDWFLDVLYLLKTKVHKGHRQNLAYLIVRRTGDAYASWLCNGLHASSDVHAVTKQVA